MAEEIAFENGRIYNFEGLVTLTLTVDGVILHTVVHQPRPRPTYAKFHWNIINFSWTDGCTDGRTFETGFIKSTLSKSRTKKLALIRRECFCSSWPEHLTFTPKIKTNFVVADKLLQWTVERPQFSRVLRCTNLHHDVHYVRSTVYCFINFVVTRLNRWYTGIMGQFLCGSVGQWVTNGLSPIACSANAFEWAEQRPKIDCSREDAPSEAEIVVLLLICSLHCSANVLEILFVYCTAVDLAGRSCQPRQRYHEG